MKVNSCANTGLHSLNSWLATLGVTPITAWRWRKKGWLATTNICGRIYVSSEAIAEFERRASAGEFAQVHKAPQRKSQGEATDGKTEGGQ